MWLVAHDNPVDEDRYWGSLPAGNSTTGCLEKLRQLGEGPRVLFHYGGPRGWGVLQVADHSPLGPLCTVASHVSKFRMFK